MSIMENDTALSIDECKQVAVHAAQVSGAILKKYFRSNIAVEIKADNSPVTLADKQAEEAIREVFSQHFPEHGIIGEEFAAINPDAEYQWVIDPIDGTKSFVSGFFDFGTIIGLLQQGKPILGLVHQPILNEIIIGDNKITTLNGAAIKAKNNHDLSNSVLLTTDYDTISAFQDDAGFKQLIKKVQHSKTWGNCYGYVMLAMGNADIMIDPIMKLWDIAGIIPIIKGAGGVISDYQGNEALHSNSLVASATEQLHQQVLACLNV